MNYTDVLGCDASRIKAHEVPKIGTSLLFRKNCSPPSVESGDLVIPDNLYLFLFERCYPQAYVYLFHLSFGGISTGLVTHYL